MSYKLDSIIKQSQVPTALINRLCAHLLSSICLLRLTIVSAIRQLLGTQSQFHYIVALQNHEPSFLALPREVLVFMFDALSQRRCCGL